VLIVIATLPGKPDKRAEIAAMLTKAAAASRGDAGCISYAFHVDLEDADRYVSVEVWQDQAALDAHFAAPHLAELMAAAADLFAGPPVIETHHTA
jgi:quinol monooxygenase YgiN